MELSKIEKLRIAVQVIELLKENKHDMFYSLDNNDLDSKIARKAGIHISPYQGEAGRIDISEYISLTRDELEMRLFRKKVGDRKRFNHGVRRFPDYNSVIGEELINKSKIFEIENIPPSGHSKTLIGEIFRAIQYIQYRAFNDGDVWFIIGSPSFMSGMYLMSMIDILNSNSYSNETGNYGFKFTNKHLDENSWDNKISNCIEHSLAEDADFIKYQLIDLLENNKLIDSKNEYDSRDFKILK